MKSGNYEPTFHTLVQGDAVSPNVLTCTHRIPVQVPAGALPTAKPTTADQIYARSAVGHLPDWMEGFRAHALAAIAETMAAMKRPVKAPKGPFAFDLFHRLDDVTFVGKPVGEKVPILAVALGEKILKDGTGAACAKMLKQALTKVGDPTKFFQVDLRAAAKLAHLYAKPAQLAIEECFRLVSLFEDVNVGRPVGSVALMGGETRVITLTRVDHSEVGRKTTETVVDKVTKDSTRTFTSTFNRIQRQDRKTGSEVTWGRTSASKSGEDSTQQTSGGKNTFSLDRFAQTTKNVLDSVVTRRTEMTNITLYDEKLTKETTTTTDSRRITITNASAQPVTYIYHQLNHRYRTLLDLVGVSVVLDDLSISPVPVRMQLDGTMSAVLESLPGIGVAKAKAIAVAVAKQLRAHYAGKSLVAAGNEPVVKVAPGDDTSMSIFSRAAMRDAKRRTKDKLPINVLTLQHAVQTGDVHVVPHLAEFSIPPPAPAG